MRRTEPPVDLDPGPVPRRVRGWAAYAAAGWTVPYLMIHLHAAITASSWPLPDPPAVMRDDAKARLIEAGVCLVLVGAMLTALAMVRPWGRILPRWMVSGVAWVGAAVGVLHWAIWTLKGLLRVTGVVALEPEPQIPMPELQAYADRYDLINLTVNEPWFLGIGLLFGIAAVQYRRRERARAASEELLVAPPLWMTRGGYAGLLGTLWAFASAVAHLYWAAGGQLGQRLGLAEPDNQEEFLGHLRGYFLVVGILSVVAVPLLLALVRPFGARLAPARGRRLLERPAMVLAALFLLGGLFIVLIGVMSFNAWIFAFYGPALMAGGVLFELAIWHHRLRDRGPEPAGELVTAAH